MKKAWMAFIILAVAALPAVAANITVVSPVAGATLEIGKSLSITWTFAGLPATAKVSIFLCQGSVKLGNIAQNLDIGSAGQGTFAWTAGSYIGGTATAGSGFFIKMRTGDGLVVGKSGLFTLAAKPGGTGGTPPIQTLPGNTIPAIGLKSAPCLAVTSPKAGAVADPVNVVYVMWTKNGSQDANVSVTLLRRVTGKARILGTEVTLAASTPNDSQFNWDPVSLNPAPGIYAIRVRTLDGKCEAVSGDFSMQESGGVELLSPKGGEVWESGTSHAVTWKRLGNIQFVDILLNRANSTYMTLAKGVDAKLGTRTCVFERSPYDEGNPCHYVLFLKHSAGGSSAASGCITLTGNPDLAIAAVNFQGLVNVGNDQTLSVKVENKGEVASQPCQGSIKVNGASAKTFPVPAIPAGGSATVPVTWKVSCPGTITITVDSGGANVEADKANNVWEKNIC